MATFYRALGISLLIFLGLAGSLRASHLLGGEITFSADTTANPNPLRYFYKLVTYTDGNSVADNPEATLELGDGITVTADRTSKILIDSSCSIVFASTYYFEHTFAGPGLYTAVYREVNRTNSINIANADQQLFAISATVYIDLFDPLRFNHRFLSPPIFCAVLNQPFRHSLAAFNPGSDSLVYTFITPQTSQTAAGILQDVTGYQLPDQASLNARTGELTWLQPDRLGTYNFAVRVSMYRDDVLMGTYVRDFVVNIIQPAELRQTFTIENRADLSITDQNQITLTAGQPLVLKIKYETNGTAKRLLAFSDLPYQTLPYTLDTASSGSSGTATFTVTPPEAWRRRAPYTLVFRGLSFLNGAFARQDFTLTLVAKPETVSGHGPDLPGEPAFTQLFLVYPNPARSKFWVRNGRQLQQTRFRLYNAQQQLVHEEKLLLRNTPIHLPTVAAGLYFYQILSAKETVLQSGKLQLE